MSKSKTQGKFWPHVRQLIWEKAQELYQIENAKTMHTDFKGTTATRKELREGGYFHTAKLIILRNLYLQNKTSSAKTPYREYHDKNRKHSCTLELQKGKGYIKA